MNTWKITLTQVSEVDSLGNMEVSFSITDNVTKKLLYENISISGQADSILTIGKDKIAELKRQATEKAKLKVGDTFLI